MVTRNIKANTATQVNANLIGVQVRPQVVPPTYEVNELVANIQVDHLICDNMMNDFPMVHFSADSTNSVWGYSGNNLVVDGVTYNAWECLYGLSDPSQWIPGGVVYTVEGTNFTDNTQFYYYTDDPAPSPMKPGPITDYVLKYGNGLLFRFDPNGDYYVFDGDFTNTYLNGNPECELVDGFFRSKETGEFLGKYMSEESYVEESIACAYWGESGSYFKWRVDYDIEVYLYSDIRNPYEGYNLRSNDAGTEAYLSPVTEVYEEEADPGYTEDIDCTLSYSVDGSTWTEWLENMTDANNVISNIPRYMYLKFSQDVVITEE